MAACGQPVPIANAMQIRASPESFVKLYSHFLVQIFHINVGST